MTDSKRIEQQAADWLVRRDAGDWAPHDQQALEAWLSASARHKVRQASRSWNFESWDAARIMSPSSQRPRHEAFRWRSKCLAASIPSVAQSHAR